MTVETSLKRVVLRPNCRFLAKMPMRSGLRRANVRRLAPFVGSPGPEAEAAVILHFFHYFRRESGPRVLYSVGRPFAKAEPQP